MDSAPLKGVSPLVVFLAFGILGITVYAFVLTNGTWNFLGTEVYGLAFNSYATSIYSGSLTVSPESIGMEGFYVDDKVYMYFGALPAVLRGPLIPFVDLESVFVSRIFILLFCGIGALLFQWWSVRIVAGQRPIRLASWDFLLLALISVNIWFATPQFFLGGSGTIYHEPIAVGLLLWTVFVLMVFNIVALNKKISSATLVGLALLAALCLHARATMAVGMYAATCLVVLWSLCKKVGWWPKPGHRDRPIRLARLLRDLLPEMTAMSLLAIGGGILLAMNFAKWGDPFVMALSEFRGFVLTDEGGSEAIQAFREHGRFNLARLPSNAVFHFVGGWNLRETLLEAFNAGFVRAEKPLGRLILMWPVWLALAAAGVWGAARGVVTKAISDRLVWLGTGVLAVPAILILSFVTVALRYKADIWATLFFFVLLGLNAFIPVWQSFSGVKKALVAVVLGGATFGSVIYNLMAVLKMKPGISFAGQGFEDFLALPMFRFLMDMTL